MKITPILQIYPSVNLKEHLVELLNDENLEEFNFSVAFVTLNGLNELQINLGTELINKIKEKNIKVKFIVGIDAVTTAEAVRILDNVDRELGDNFTVKVFDSSIIENVPLFHPKLYIFKHEGKRTIIIGSNNLTPGGLYKNIELFIRIDEINQNEMESWDDIWANLSKNSIPITPEIIGKLVRPSRRYRRVLMDEEETTDIDEIGNNHILLRYVPRAKGRTSQVHFTKYIVENYFNMDLMNKQRVNFQQIQPGEAPQHIENRTLVYSLSNRNPKFEIRGMKSTGDYGARRPRPILIFEKLLNDFYKYMLILPGQPGYPTLSHCLNSEPRRGRALPFKILYLNELLELWSDYPH